MSISIILDPNELKKKQQLPSYRLALYNAIKNKQISITPCNMTTLLDDSKVLKKTSSSDSVIVFGKLKFKINDPIIAPLVNVARRDIILKLSFQAVKDSLDNSLQIEVDIYDKIINRLLIDKYTPNVMLCVGVFQCDDFLQDITNKLAKDPMNKLLEDIVGQMDVIEKTERRNIKIYREPSIYNLKRVNVLMLERGKGMTFGDWSKESKSIREWKSVLFQILYTLKVFNKIGLRHNDIHLDNIWIETLSNEKEMIYFVDENTYYMINTTNLVKIFDFDLSTVSKSSVSKSSVSKIMENTKLTNDFCDSYGMCNNYNPYFDVFLVFCNLYITIQELKKGRTEEADFLKKFIKSQISLKLLSLDWGFPCRLCNLIGPGQCKGDFIDSELDIISSGGIKTISDMISSYAFNEFRHDIKSYNPKYHPSTYEDVFFAVGLNQKQITSQIKKI